MSPRDFKRAQSLANQHPAGILLRLPKADNLSLAEDFMLERLPKAPQICIARQFVCISCKKNSD